MIIDIILAIVSLSFVYALIPQVILGFKTKKGLINIQTSTITFIGMYVVTICYFLLHLYFASIINFILGSLWLTLFIQGVKYEF